MKTLIKFCIFFLLFCNTANSQVPEYGIQATGFAPSLPDITNSISFSIDVIWVHPGSVSNYNYAGGQFFFNFNPAIANGGTLSFEYDTVGMSSGFGGEYTQALRTNLRPRNPQIFGSQLRLAVNTFPGAGNGQDITSDLRGCVIIRLKLSTTASEFAHVPLGIAWRNNPLDPPATKMFAYVGTTNTEITDTFRHYIDYGGLLPVELSSFSSSINKNNISLSWITAHETNNSGFEVERSIVNNASLPKQEWSVLGFVQGQRTTTTPENYTFADRGLNSGKYKYRLKQVDFNGNFEYYNLSQEVEVGVPKEFSISQNYPNPFNPTTKLDYQLPLDAIVNITVYDMTGREVRKLINGMQTAGYYKIEFNGNDLSSGMYFYRISAGNFVTTKKMTLIK